MFTIPHLGQYAYERNEYEIVLYTKVDSKYLLFLYVDIVEGHNFSQNGKIIYPQNSNNANQAVLQEFEFH